ncbi:hypothetical protein R6V09_13835 [Streptomyces sp. W16]|uniref:hypothetical protein n=1 Tax=Streptomyces sp. W16 TaxID=3076631 RepID=UPI00295AD286|nr:hypothetical protein [Streptomyces sp. W16]MDV9171202.1 hypothetical protein [Streptomyces sp. W16]
MTKSRERRTDIAATVMALAAEAAELRTCVTELRRELVDVNDRMSMVLRACAIAEDPAARGVVSSIFSGETPCGSLLLASTVAVMSGTFHRVSFPSMRIVLPDFHTVVSALLPLPCGVTTKASPSGAGGQRGKQPQPAAACDTDRPREFVSGLSDGQLRVADGLLHASVDENTDA